MSGKIKSNITELLLVHTYRNLDDWCKKKINIAQAPSAWGGAYIPYHTITCSCKIKSYLVFHCSEIESYVKCNPHLWFKKVSISKRVGESLEEFCLLILNRSCYLFHFFTYIANLLLHKFLVHINLFHSESLFTHSLHSNIQSACLMNKIHVCLMNKIHVYEELV